MNSSIHIDLCIYTLYVWIVRYIHAHTHIYRSTYTDISTYPPTRNPLYLCADAVGGGRHSAVHTYIYMSTCTDIRTPPRRVSNY